MSLTPSRTTLPDPAELIQRIHQDIQMGKLPLPSLPNMALRVRQAVTDLRKSNHDIAKIVQLDPPLAARIIQIANSPLYRGRFPSDDCLSAITRLGLESTRNFVISFTLRQNFFKAPAGIKQYLTDLWSHSCHVAAISYVLAGTVQNMQADRALLAGLLHDIGVMSVLYYLCEWPQCLKNREWIDQIIQKLRGPLGTLILKYWKFDTELTHIPQEAENWLRQNNKPIDYIDIVIVAQALSLIKKPYHLNVPQLDEIPAYHKFCLNKLGPDASIELLSEAQEELDSMLGLLGA